MDFDTFVRTLESDSLINKTNSLSLGNSTSTKGDGKRYKALENRINFATKLQQEKDASKLLAASEEKMKEHDLNISGLEYELKELDKRFAHLQKKETIFTAHCKDLKAKTSPSERDAKILDTLKKKFLLYKEISGLKWDFTCPEDEMRGYVRNKRAGTTMYFNLTGKPLEKVWELLKEASHEEWP